MDKLTLISGTLFLAADIFAIVSLAMPDWITTEVGGTSDTRLGLMWTCMTLYNRQPTCFTPDLQPEWLLALVCIFVGCICITTTIILLISSHWDRNVVPYARWVGFTARSAPIPCLWVDLIRAFPLSILWFCFASLLSSSLWDSVLMKLVDSHISYHTVTK
ncbi:uncharacterized protein C16orf52 homolog B isoform X3 [Schistocerca nitens]|uniref:uncharacterized protein C16orf52 homolog B isoform X3 n=1 Tax=Schistocerca nitens TaxID=7011 RepID=UPI002118F5C5|nr:uncharacterized protein C16orf52 homolog B isoform X3 [Schistocerca nitens]